MGAMMIPAKRKRPARVEPRVNARRSGSDPEERPNLKDRLIRMGRRVAKGLYVITLLGLCLAGCAGLFILARELGPLTKAWFVVQRITIEGLDHVSRREVMSRLALKADTALYSINPAWLAERVRQHPWIKDATVTLVPFHEVRVTVVERRPAAVVRTLNDNVLTDEDGYVLARLGAKDDVSLPVLSGVDARGLIQGKVDARIAVKTGTTLAGMISAVVGGRPEVNVAQLSNLVVSVHGVTFQFSATSMDQQWHRFLKMRPALRDVAFDNEGEQSQEIDLRYMDRVIVRGRG
jgi:cell division protein FtsQ